MTTDDAPLNAGQLAFLAGGGEMGERVRAFDWSAHPLGPPAAWPQGLQAAASICLNSRFPIVLWWGADLRLIYNDAWRPVLGRSKHPQALGSPGREVWPEIWHIIGPMLEGVLSEGKATWSDDQLLPLDRNGYLEEAYFTYSYSPILGDGGRVGGVFAAVNETTERVIGERRLKTLRTLAAQAALAKSADEACRAAMTTLAASSLDLPFALLYLLDEGLHQARLAGATGLPDDHPARPTVVPLTGDPVWPLAQVTQSGPMLLELDARHGELPVTSWPVPARQAVLLPLMASGLNRLVGVLILGVNPGRDLDEEHRGFHELVAGHVATAITNARAYEEERKRAEALAELDRAKTAFFSNVSHEFRTPLTLMLGPVEDMLAKPAEQVLPDNRELLTVIHRNGLRLQRLVNSLLDFSRIEAGRVRATYEPTDLAEFTADLASNFRSACEKAGLRLVVDCPPLGEPMFVDRPMYEKIVLNLLSNAFKFTLEGGITVSLRRAGPQVQLQVRDTGTGIPADEMPRIFERFHRVENARGRTHEGSGIGLALVQELVKLHGGTITAESEAGSGTRFTVVLPVGADHLPPDQVHRHSASPVQSTAATSFVQEALHWLPQADAPAELVSYQDDLQLPLSSGGSAEGDRPRIVVADDNADMRRYVVRLLSGQFTVEAVPDGEAALAAVRQRRPEVIISDVMMPRLDGFGLLKALRSDPGTATLPVILLSARAGEESRVEGVEAGADDYLVKPFSARELVARVTAQVQMARLRREVNEALQEQQNKLREAQRASEERLRNIFDQSLAGVAQTDLTGRFVQVNARYCEIVGRSADELSRLRMQDITHPEDLSRNLPLFERMVQGVGQSFVIEKRYLRPDGGIIWVSNSVSLLRAPSGEPEFTVAVCLDITDRKRAEDERERFFAVGADVLVIAGSDGHFKQVSPTVERTLGWTPDELTAQPWAEFLHPDDRAATLELDEQVKQGKEVLSFENRYRHKDGSYRWLNWRAKPFPAEGLIYAGATDVTERKLAESLRTGKRNVLELIATGKPLADVLTAICRVIEEQEEGLLCSILLTDDDGRHTGQAFGPSLPQEFVQALEGIDISRPHVGSCCHALDCGQEVLVADIEHDGRWSALWRDLNLHHGLRSCRSIPIHGSDGVVLASVAVFRRRPGDPGPANKELLDIATHLAGIAIERKRADEAVRQSELRYRLVGQAANDAIWDWDLVTNQVTWSEGVRQVFQYAPDQIDPSATWWYETIHPDDRERVVHGIHAVIDGGGEDWRDEYRFRRADGFYAEVFDRGRVVRQGGKATRMVGSMLDVTARKMAEEALRASERRFRQLADAMAQIVWTARPDGEIDYLNRRWAEFTGLPDDIGNKGWSHILHPDDAPAARKQWAISLRSGEPFEMEVRLFDRREQSYRWHLIRTVAVTGEDGNVARWFGTSTDIHQQKRAEESSRYLAEASAALAGVVDFESTLQKVVNLAVPYFGDWSAVDVSDGNGRLRRLAVAHKDRAKIELAHELIRDYPPDPQSPVGAYAVFRTGKPEFIAEISDEMLVASAQDERHLELIRSLGLKSYICLPLIVSGQTLGVLTFATAESGRRYNEADLATATDLVQRAAVAIENTQLYQALKDADRRKDEFLATLAHELRNPLAPLRNGLQVLRLAGTNGEMADQARTMMERQLSQMVHLIDDLLDLSRISRGKIELRKERVALSRIVQQAVETSRPAIEAAGHEFLIDVPALPIYVDADVTRLAQVFSNLLNNAAKYTEAGRVRLAVQQQGTEAVVSVRDTGIGIPAHMLPHVFEMFTQVDRNLERSQGGLGIGLSIVKRLVEMHGGSVVARSDGHGMGSEFVVRLPVVLSVVQPPSDDSEPQPSSSRRRVLVVDDNKDAAVSLAMMLQLMGNEAKTAHDGREALDVAAVYRPDLILLDIGMPKLNGYDTARQIRQQAWGKSVVLVALTGWGQDEDRRKSHDAGFDSHITKPIEPASLEKLLAGLKAETG